jgi:iron(III) transport system substrate-binding protein
MKRAVVVLGSFIVLMATGCQKSEPPNKSGGPSGNREVVVYSSADKEFAELIFRAYEQKTGVTVLPLYDTEETKTAGLTSRLVAEKDHPRADVFWSSDTSRAVALVEQGVAESYVPKESAAISARYRSPTGLWTGFAVELECSCTTQAG